MAAEPMTTINTRYPKRLVDAIDSIVASRLDGTDRSAVIRELLAEAIEARSLTDRKRRA